MGKTVINELMMEKQIYSFDCSVTLRISFLFFLLFFSQSMQITGLTCLLVTSCCLRQLFKITFELKGTVLQSYVTAVRGNTSIKLKF